MTGEKRCNASFNFQPVLYRCSLNRKVRSKTRSAIDIPVASSPQLNDCVGLLFLIDSLRKGGCRAEEQKRCT